MDSVVRIVEKAPERMKALVVLAVGSGLRSGEMLGLDASRIDFLRREIRVDRQLVYIPGRAPFLAPPKTPESIRTVPMPKFVVDALAKHLAENPAGPDDLIFQAEKGGPMAAHDSQRPLATHLDAGKAAGDDASAPPAAPVRDDARRRRSAVHDGGRVARAHATGRDLGGLHASSRGVGPAGPYSPRCRVEGECCAPGADQRGAVAL